MGVSPYGDIAKDAAVRAEAQAANSGAAAESRAAARTLREAGLTTRDIGAVLGVSFQRAHQLIR